MAFSNVFSSNHFHLLAGLVLIMGCLAGCASTSLPRTSSVPEAPYIPEAPKWAEVPPTAPQAIDGEWRTGRLIDHFEKGRGRVLNSKSLDPLDVVFKNIQKVGPGKYTLEVMSWNNTSRISGFATGEIEIISPTEIVLRMHPNQITGWGGDKRILTLVSIENEPLFLQEIEDLGMEVDLVTWKKAQKSKSVSAYEKSIRDYPMLFFTQTGEDGISSMKTVFTEKNSFSINVHIKPCVKSKWHVSISSKNGSEKFKVGHTYEVSYRRTQTKGTGTNCVRETILGSSFLSDLAPGLYTAKLVIGGAVERSVDFTVAPQ